MTACVRAAVQYDPRPRGYKSLFFAKYEKLQINFDKQKKEMFPTMARD